MRYIALIDGTPGAYGVMFPDLSGCTAMAGTLDQAMTFVAEALQDWINIVEISGNAIPAARSADALRTDPEVSGALAEGASLVEILARQHLPEMA